MCTKKFSELTIPDGYNLQGLKGRVNVSFFSLKKQQKKLYHVSEDKNETLTSNLFMIIISTWNNKASCKQNIRIKRQLSCYYYSPKDKVMTQ